MNGCACGKNAWSTKAEADRVVINAKIRSGLHQNTRRREQRAYPCPLRPGTWHVTSQPDAALPDYPPTDDEAATEFISTALRHQHDPTWNALLDDDLVEQTCRVLECLHHQLLAQEMERNSRVDSLRARCRAAEVPFSEVDRAVAERAEWKMRVAHFQAAVLHRLDAARQAVKTLNLTRSSDRNRRENQLHRQGLRRLTLAVTRHLAATDQPTAADRELWAWLTVLTVPFDDVTATLADMVAARRWAETPGQLRDAL